MTVADVARDAFLRACWLDVAVRKPGNVSLASPGHGMDAAMFVASASAAAGPLFERGARVGARIEAAVAASWEATGCNTNLGIVLLCAPLAAAFERAADDGVVLREATVAVLADLDLADTHATYRAIAMARPGGLGQAEAEDVQHAPTLALCAAMALAADRDLIARQYDNSFAEAFAFAADELPSVFPLSAVTIGTPPDSVTRDAVQRLCIGLLATLPDSHIVRKHGEAVAHNVMTAAQDFRARALLGMPIGEVVDFVAWDEALKAARINPGTTADFTVACLFIAGLRQALGEWPVARGTDRDRNCAAPVDRPALRSS